jgi:hypothetical protein
MSKLILIVLLTIFACQFGSDTPRGLPRTIRIFSGLSRITNLPNGYHLSFRKGFVDILNDQDEVKYTLPIENLHSVTISPDRVCFHCINETISYNYNWEKIDKTIDETLTPS